MLHVRNKRFTQDRPRVHLALPVVYWPMYAALHQAELEYSVAFEFVLVDTPTDSGIRDQAATAECALALCGPATSDRGSRHITLLWRLPHWRLTRNRSHVPGSQPPEKSVLIFPKDTTSGDFA